MLKGGFLHRKGAPRQQKWPELAHKSGLNWPKRAQNHPQNITFRSGRGPDRCHIGNQPLYFHLIILSKVIMAQEGVPTSQKSFPTTKATRIDKKSLKSPQKYHIPSVNDPTIVSKIIRAQEGVPRSQSGSPTTKSAFIDKKGPKSPQKYRVPLLQGTRQMLHRQSTTLFSLNDPK